MTVHGPTISVAGEYALEHHVPQRGLLGQAWRRFVRKRAPMVGLAIIVVLVMMAALTALVPAVERHDPARQQFTSVQSGPSSEHWFGTDNLGRDLWARTWEGLRISLRIGIGTQVIVVAIGILVGAVAAVGGRFADAALMRFTDMTYAFPDLLAIILLRAVLSEREWPIIGTGDPQIPGFPGPLVQVMLAIALVSWVTTARLVRGQMLSLRNTEYAEAARAMGASGKRVVFVHLLPNALSPVIVTATFGVPLAIFAEAVLGYIGFSLPSPTASLGTLVNSGFRSYRVNPWAMIIPSVAIALLMLAFTLVGDGLRDAIDPRTRR
jgi:oligopeptide transport system permease protein